MFSAMDQAGHTRLILNVAPCPSRWLAYTATLAATRTIVSTMLVGDVTQAQELLVRCLETLARPGRGPKGFELGVPVWGRIGPVKRCSMGGLVLGDPRPPRYACSALAGAAPILAGTWGKVCDLAFIVHCSAELSGRGTGLGFANGVIGLVVLYDLALCLGSVLLAPSDGLEALAG